MMYNTSDTEWPSSTTVPEAAKALLDTYFNLLDTNSKEVGDRLADEVFTSDGVIIGPSGEIRGAEAIRKCRLEAWKVIKARKHRLLRVYVHDVEARDLFIIGDVTQGLSNGKELSGEWTARIRLEEKDGKFKIKYHKVWADFQAAQKAIQELMAA